MKPQHVLCVLTFYSMLIVGAFCLPGCANIMPPTGGPKDTIPPRLVSAVPIDSEKHFAEKKIILNFSEYVDGKDLRTELLVNPVPKVDPIVDAKLKVITIRIKDSLQANTTYSLNFGKGIKDVNEGNVLRNFIYVFTTGDAIDKGDFTGNVYVANTGRADSTIIAMLHVSDTDSAVIKNRPRYIAKTDSTGRFHFQFVKPGKYWLYAVKDEGGAHKYLSKSQLFAFADSPVVIGPTTPPVTMYAYAEIAETKSSSSGGSSGGTSSAPKKPKKNETRIQVAINAQNGAFDVLDTFRLTFSSGLKIFDSTQIRFTDENFKDLPLNQYRYVRDTTARIFTLLYKWPTDTKYHLIIPRTFGQDSLGRKLIKDDTLNFKTKKDIEYGEVQIRVMNVDLTRHPVLLFIQGDKIKYSQAFNSRRTVRKILFAPGEYELRILYDTNQNGVWDPGKFFGKVKKQPERVITIRKKMNIKANWDNDWDATL
jgi:hypothetical protein